MVKIRDFDVREITPEVALVTYRTIGERARRRAAARYGCVGSRRGRSCSTREPKSTIGSMTASCHSPKGGHRLVRP